MNAKHPVEKEKPLKLRNKNLNKNGREKLHNDAPEHLKETHRLNKRYISLSPETGARQVLSNRGALKDTYHFLMEASWLTVIGIMALLFLAVNVLFGLLYHMGDTHTLGNLPGNTFLEDFFFSVQTFATIGYGYWYPQSTYSNIVMTLEAFTQLVGTAVMTGLIFAKFSIPKAKVLFSHYVVMSKVNGQMALRLRLANARGNQIVEAKITVTVLVNETTDEGEFMRRLHDLELDRTTTPMFALSWLVTHHIDNMSPLHNMTDQDFVTKDLQIVVSLIGIDGSSSQTIHSRHFYTMDKIKCNSKFADIILSDENGKRYIDFNNFHTIEEIS